VVRELPDECLIRVDVNGCLAGTVLAIPDAPRELATGWAFMYGFFDTRGELGRVTVDAERVSVMVESGEDIDLRRLEAVGWAESAPISEPEPSEGEPFYLGEAQLLQLIDATWQAFRRDGGNDGYLHVAVASGSDIRCVARDRTTDMAAAKVLGWALLNGCDEGISVLVVRGIVGRRLVEAAARLGISVIVTSAIPTSEAYRAATGLSLSIIGMAMSRSIGLLIDGGHIIQ
jgi:formate dehydrogenase accessory protein FdhD